MTHMPGGSGSPLSSRSCDIPQREDARHGRHDNRAHRADAAGADPRGARRPYRAESHGSWQSFDGYTDSPDRGTAARGHAYLAAAARAVGRAFVEFHTATGGRRLASDED